MYYTVHIINAKHNLTDTFGFTDSINRLLKIWSYSNFEFQSRSHRCFRFIESDASISLYNLFTYKLKLVLFLEPIMLFAHEQLIFLNLSYSSFRPWFSTRAFVEYNVNFILSFTSANMYTQFHYSLLSI